MSEYQIRIVARNGEAAAYSCHCASVFAVVRRAKSIASVGDGIEVWSGMECVFADQPQIAPQEVKDAIPVLK